MFKKFIGSKEFNKRVLVIAIPLMLQQLIATSVNLLDNLMIGQLGSDALAAVTAINRYFLIAIFASLGLMAAATVYIAQFYGAKEEENMKAAFRFGLISTMSVTLLFVIAAFVFDQQIISFFVKDEAILGHGLDYIHVAALTFVPNAIVMAVGGAMRSIGESKLPLIASVISVFTNAFFNYVLIYGHMGFPKLGVFGGALGTLIARFVELAFILYYLKKGDFAFKTKLKDLFHIPAQLAKRIWVKALPLLMNEILWASGMALLLKLYATRGNDVISGYSIASSLADLFFTMNAGMSIASTILISQPLGANKLEEARQNAYNLIGFAVMLGAIFGVLMFIMSFAVPYMYSVSDESMHIALTFIRYQSFLFIVYVMNTTCYFILRAGGDTRSTLILDSLYMWTVNLSIVSFFTYFTSVNIISLFLIGQMTDVIKFAISYRFVKKERWVMNLADHGNEESLSLA